jgi:hypothetical protein
MGRASLYTRDLGRQDAPEGLNRLEAEFVTEHLTVEAEITSPETRMSDYLNSSAQSVEVHPLRVRTTSGTVHDLSETMAHLTKSQLMFVIPISEPQAADAPDGSGWAWHLKYRCWAALGRYLIVGDVHAENYRDPKLLLRALEQRQFLAFSDAELTYPDGSTKPKPIVIVNHRHLEMLSVPKPRW